MHELYSFNHLINDKAIVNILKNFLTEIFIYYTLWHYEDQLPYIQRLNTSLYHFLLLSRYAS